MKRRPPSLVVRLTVSIGAVITAVLLTFGWMMERSINNHFVQQDKAAGITLISTGIKMASLEYGK